MSKKNLRRISQGIFLLLFLFLFIQTESKGDDTLGYPVKLFLDFDPFIFITTVLATHTAKIPAAFFLSITVILVTAVLGRVFCGWVCPLGTLNNLVSSLKKRHQRTLGLNWHKLKYYILIFIIASSLFTLQIAGIMDPLSLLIRSFSLSIYPLFNYGTRALFDAIYNTNIPGIVDISESIYGILKKSILSFQQPYFLQSVFIGLLFFTVLGLNLVEKRFWCRYLCPLGAFLGLFSRYSLLRREVSEGCTSCGACDAVCQGGAFIEDREAWKKTECLACFNCDDICPANAVSFGFGIKKATSMDLGRRQVLFSVFSGAVAVPLIRSTPFLKQDYSEPRLLRPPGALEEKEFLKRCVKCGECMKVCITNGLQPTLLEAGIEGIWSPILIPVIGYCEYRCTLCGQVCPSGAIQNLSLEEKMKVKIGLAMIDKGRCLPYSHNTPCIVCEEVCPTPEKAIWFEETLVKDRAGKEILLKQPHVDLNLCIGCGICEAKCPVGSHPAIYVTNIGESRNSTNQLLL
ncbi:MAG: 4Fe-4S binding protein [Nitrospirae bacterium]|nr:4Fe-4S binding protein [Nitrospirota bacterium]